MSVNSPPTPNVSTFNNLYWISADEALSQSQADLRYLKFPVAQGTENLQATNINGALTVNSTANFTALSAPTSSQTLLPSNENSNKIPTTAWVQSILTNAGSVYSRIYTSSQTITMPANCRSIDLFLQGQGGACGTSDGTFYGGSGSGGNTCCVNNLPMSEGEILTVTISSSTFVSFNSAVIAQALSGLNGTNSGSGDVPGGASNTTTGVIDTTLGAFYTTYGNAGASSSGGGIMPPIMSGVLGCPKGVSAWVNGGYGMGQQQPFGPIGPGYVLVTYHLGV